MRTQRSLEAQLQARHCRQACACLPTPLQLLCSGSGESDAAGGAAATRSCVPADAHKLRQVQAAVQGVHMAANAPLHVSASLPTHCSGCACRGRRPTTGTSGAAALPARCRLSRCGTGSNRPDVRLPVDARACSQASVPCRTAHQLQPLEGQCSSLGRGQNSSRKAALESPRGALDGCAAVRPRCAGWGLRLRRLVSRSR